MTFPAIYLIEVLILLSLKRDLLTKLLQSMGRRSLLGISTFSAFISLILVGYGIDSSMKGLSSFSIVAFVASVHLVCFALPTY